MFDLEDVKNQVIRNCQISDARYAGLYSICGLALRLRDLFKWEMGLEPWDERESDEQLEWIGEKEDEWERLVDLEFKAIDIGGRLYDPFDVSGINSYLEPRGYIYSAGFAHNMKPRFLLARIDGRREMEGRQIYILGQELARDLLTLPALSQDSSIYILKESGRLFLWNQIFYIGNSGRKALKFALESHGVSDQSPKQIREHLHLLFRSEMERYIYHELGESSDKDFDRHTWRQLISTFPHSPIELLARSIKDLLADMNNRGALRHIIKKKMKTSLGFYVAFQSAFSKVLFPEVARYFIGFTKSGDWDIIDQAVSSGYERLKMYAGELVCIFNTGMRDNNLEGAKKEIEKRLLIPLGIRDPVETSS
jgi:hypothetical protein